jgi:ABC-type dipeptide/oligopeptide/nickel transport system permease component
MLAYIVRRLLVTIPIVFAVIFITFTLGFYGPGDPLRMYYGERYDSIDAETIARLNHEYGLDRPFVAQFGSYLSGLARGDMGESILMHRPVKDVILKSLPISMQLGFAALFLVIIIGIPLGVFTALRQNSFADHGVLFSTIMLSTIPPFVLAPLLMILFILKIPLLPSTIGWDGIFSIKAILPVIILAVGPMVLVVRYTRYGVIEALSQEYVRTARAKGLSTSQIMRRHVLPNALTPVVTALGFSIAGLITGSIFIEVIFGIPGFGGQIVRALTGSDYPMLLGTTMVGALIIVITNLIVDIIYALLDPRVRLND